MPVMRLDCRDVERDELVERYLADRLTDGESESFEAHYLTCERCQAELRMGAAVREALAGDAATGGAAEGAVPNRGSTTLRADASPPSRRRLLISGSIGLAAAAAAFLLLLPGDRVDPALAALGGVGQPPIYLGVEVRSEEVPGEATFEAGMAAYGEERWADAVAELRAAREAGMEPLPAGFFLAAALLLDDRPAEAAEAFQRVIDLGETPYETEALFYRAKALLRVGRADSALAELEEAAGADMPGVSIHAAALADSVRRVMER